MASLRRSRTTTADGASPRFLYAILKQLDLKSIDWNDVAGNLDITNGHAARMRFSRFKQQMEGVQTPRRKPKPAKEEPKLNSKAKTKTEKRLRKEGPEIIKEMPGQPAPSLYDQAPVENSVRIKDEPFENSYQGNVGHMEWMSLEPRNYPKKEPTVPKLERDDPSSSLTLQAIKEEPKVKIEPWGN